MGGVFVSYRTGDGDWAATLIARELATRFGRHNVFLASKSIRLGEDFAERIEARLRECDVLLVVVGARWRTIRNPAGQPRIDDENDWVNREIVAAMEHGLRLIPVLLDGVSRLDESELPAIIARLARSQYLRLHHRNDDRDIARLLDELAELVPGFEGPRSVPGPPAEDDSAPCPYRGLQPFREEDAAVFHGRDREIARLTHLAAHRPVVVVAGASGSGKSSLVRAGLWPVLRRENVALAAFRPIAGVPPRELLIHALRTALGANWHDRWDDRAGDLALLADPIAEAAGELVLCVDQFEELAGSDPAAAKELFDLVAELVHAAPSRPGGPPALRAVFTMRSAGVEEVLTAELCAVLEESTVYVRALGPAELRAAITEPPAATGHTEFEPGLVERIVTDARDAPGQLPLVEFALTRLWESRREGLLTHQAYDEMGGVGGALAAYAEEFYTERLPAGRRSAAERLLVQLARPGEDGSFRLVPARLDRLSPELRLLAAELGDSRLVVIRQDVDQPEVVALAHETLVRAWRRLHGWLVAAQEFRTWQEQLRVTLDQWHASGKDGGGLLRGAPLAAAEQWLATRPDDLTAAEREYVVAGRGHRLRGVRRWRTVTGVVAALALAASVLSVVVVQRSGELADQLHNANATLLAQEATRVGDDQPSTALQFALAAWRERPGHSGAYAALLSQYLKWRSAERLYPPDEGGRLARPQAGADGRVMALLAGPEQRVVLWEGLPERSMRWVPMDKGASAFALSRDGALLAIGTTDGEVLLWRVADRAGPFPLRQKASGGWVSTLRFDVDGRFLAATIDTKRVEMWDARKRRPLPTAITSAPSIHDAVPLRGGKAVVTHVGVRTSGDLAVRDRVSGETLRDFPKGSAVVGAGSAVASCAPAGLRIRDTATGDDRTPSPAPPPCEDGTPPIADASGQFLCLTGTCGAYTGLFTFLHWPTGRRYTIRATLPLEGETVGAAGVLDPDGGITMMVHNGDAFARVRAARPDPVDTREGAPFVTAPAFDPEHRRWLSGRADATLVLADGKTGRRLAEVPGQHREPTVVFTPKGSRALSVAGAELRVYRTPDLRLERTIPMPGGTASGRPPVAALSEREAALVRDGLLTRWNLDTGRPVPGPIRLAAPGLPADRVGIRARPGHPGQVVAVTEAGVDVWDLGRRKRIARLQGGPRADGPQVVALEPSGTRLAAVSRARGEVEVWDVDASRALRPIPGPVLGVLGFVGPLLVLRDNTGKIQLWRWKRAELVGTVTLPDVTARSQWLHGNELTYLEAGAPVAAVGSLRFDPEEWFARLCAVSDREFTRREAGRLPRTVRRGRPCPR